jgi:hypothetical protein
MKGAVQSDPIYSVPRQISGKSDRDSDQVIRLLHAPVYLLSRRSSTHSPSTAHATKATSAHTASE